MSNFFLTITLHTIPQVGVQLPTVPPVAVTISTVAVEVSYIIK